MPDYTLTAHAQAMVLRRRIESTWLVRALTTPDREEPDQRDASLRHALVTIIENDARVLRGVYDPPVDPPRIVTAFFDRRERRRP